MAEHLQYRYHGRFISAGDAARLSNLKGPSAYVSTSYREGRSHTHISTYARPDQARAILYAEKDERRAARGLEPKWESIYKPLVAEPAPTIPAAPAAPSPPVEYPEEEFGEAPSLEFPRGEPFEPEFDYEKEGFESPWTDDSLWMDDAWDMDWDGDVADIDDDVYIQIGS